MPLLTLSGSRVTLLPLRVPPLRPPSRALGRVAAFGAVSAVGLVAAAVLGDGYFEIAKHTWLAAYLVAVTATSVLLGLAVVAARRTFAVIEARKRRRAPSDDLRSGRRPAPPQRHRRRAGTRACPACTATP